MNATIVLPTYNERENLPEMLEALVEIQPSLQVLVVDDGSPDGTGLIAEEWAARFDRISVLHRRGERGLGSAYVAGFRRAVAMGAKALVTMDCDFSHDPAEVLRLVEQLESAEMVLGSRYVPGGTTPGWPVRRRALSAAANLFARTCLRLPVNDCTSGFRAYRGSLMRQLLQEPIGSRGYSIQVEMLGLTVHRLHGRVVEAPITFRERRHGESKISMHEVSRGMLALIDLRRAIFASAPALVPVETRLSR